MIKTLKNLLKQDKERYTVPRKVQDVIPVRRIWKDGIFQVGSRFSKTDQFTDINYRVASREDKEQMFLAYSELLTEDHHQQSQAEPGKFRAVDLDAHAGRCL